MHARLLLACLTGSLGCLTAAHAEPPQLTYRPEGGGAISAWLDVHLPQLVETYKHLHANPELSMHEEKTAALLADRLEQHGFSVHRNIGGHGVAAVLRNGPGPTLLIRGDMDALPITEETGLPYASKATHPRIEGGSVGVMHACGHDVHTTMLVGLAGVLTELKDLWSGTLVLIGQPAEELGKGSRMMLEDGLFEKVPRPDLCLALHVSADLPIGHIGYTPGWVFANVDSVDIIIYGRGGHGARPHEAVDPVVTAAFMITHLQTLISRRLDPTDPGVVTVGSIHGGSKHNIIPEEAQLQLTVRSYSDDVRRQLLDGIKQIATSTAALFGCPRPPTVTLLDEHTPASFNDPALTAASAAVFREVFGEPHVIEQEPEMGGEDFGRFAKTLGVPGLQYRIGTVDPQRYEASLRPDGPRLPPVHSSTFAPVPEPTVRIAVQSMANLALAVLGRETPGE